MTAPRRKKTPIGYRSIAERWIGGCRRELFDHVIVLNERHAVRLARAYIGYFHEDRAHLASTRTRRPDDP